jgi:D-lactate dehydrogenase (cytochrome)
MQLCIDQGGSITGEHGVGMEKRSYMPLMYDADTLQAMQDIKAVFDPHHLMNPHKLFPADMPAPAPLPAPAAPPASPYAPESAEQAAEALRAWTHAGKSIRICGSGSKAGNLPPADVQLSTGGLRGIRAYAPDDLYVVVGAGTPLHELQEHLAHNRMWVPWVSPWPEATIGGIVASNSNAPLRMRHGGICDSVLAATVALPNGRIIRVGRAVVKNVAGYDLARLFVGSYGTLGLLTDITLKLMPQPRLRTSMAIPVEEPGQGLALGAALLPHCIVASALVLCRGCETPTATAPYTLLYTGEGAAREDVLAELQQIRGVLREHKQPGVAIEEPTGSTVWASLLAAPTPAGACLRIGVAPGALPALLTDVLPLLGDAPFVADLANGMLHVRGVSQLAPLREAAHQRGGYAIVCGGAVPAGEDAWGYQPESLDLMRGIKARWDAHGLLNPGAFLV